MSTSVARRGAELALVIGATLLSLTIALGTRGFVHPDERLHEDAFRFFSVHVWPPDLGSDALRYDPYGTSKVYSREIVYVILGPVGRQLEGLIGGERPWLAFRLLNVALLPLALSALLVTRSRLVPTAALAVVLASVPQVLYVFGYANSDAWAILLSCWLFARTLRLAEAEAAWPLAQIAILGTLAGLLLASKANFVLALIFPAVVLAPRIRAAGTRALLLLVFLAALFPAPYKIVYPRTQPDFRVTIRRMTAERAEPGYRFAEPVPVGEFFVRTAESAWGVYGHMNVFHGKGVYAAAAGLALLNVAITAWVAARRWQQLPATLRRLLLAAPAVILVNLALSLRWSLAFYYQPQGRYLFPSLLPAALLVAGTAAFENLGLRRMRLVSAAVALALCAWSLLFVALPRLALN